MRVGAKIRMLALTLTFMVSVITLHAQYYSWGADPAYLKWRSARSERASVIYPDKAEQIGLTTLYLTERMRPYINYGLTLPPLDIPFVIHPENMSSNGLVMWLPKRVEFLSTPSIESYSMPWLKQLVAHEYRHAAQYNNLNVGFIKFLSYLLGQQSSTIGLIFMPLWMMEGDATMCETEASSFGRALQPKFTLEYRAMGNIRDKYRNRNKFFCGSYRDFIPDHYKLGYQMVAYGNDLAGRVMANDIAAYGARHPWTIISENWRMKRVFGFSANYLFDYTFTELPKFWNTLPKVENSSEPLPAPKFKSYTTYSNPLWVDGMVISQKRSLDKPDHIIRLNPETGKEQILCYTGSIATRPEYDKVRNRLWWTEYRRSTMFEQKVTTSLCYLDLDGSRPRTVKMGKKNILYPTPDLRGGLAWIEYQPKGIYTFHHRSTTGAEVSLSLPFGQEIHSLAWDNLTDAHYCILTGDEGMWIAKIDTENTLTHISRPAYITLSKLRAKDGRLYFGSIASGKDEVHCLDLLTGKEYQLSESEFGSFDGSSADAERIVMTTYDSLGYHLSVQPLDKIKREVAYSPLPRNLVNPPHKKWGTINLDTVSLTPKTEAVESVVKKRKPYRKGLTLFNFHSWAPLCYNPFALSESGAINLNLGATVMTQNLLSTMQGFFGYGWSQRKGHLFQGSLRYDGLGPTISLNATYGGRQNIYPIYVYNPDNHQIEFPEAPKRKRYYSMGVDISFPMMFQSGYHTRYLALTAGWEYSNGLVANTGKFSFQDGISNVATIGYKQGLHLTQFTLSYQDMVRLAHRDFAPRWGYAASVTYAVNPANGHFSDLVALYGKVYTLGLLPHNSFSLAAAYQTSLGGFNNADAVSALRFKSTRLLPRGFDSSQIDNNHYMALSLNYQAPVWYPDGGWQNVIYFKRIRVNVGYDYARFRQRLFQAEGGKVIERWKGLNSYGGDIILDINLLGQPAAATTSLKLSFYRPSEGGFFIGAGMDLPF